MMTSDIKDDSHRSAITETHGGSAEANSVDTMPSLVLLRSYFVWSLLSIPTLVNASPVILDSLLHSWIPGVSAFAETIVRRTFFAQFIPGETAVECVPVIERLRRRNVGSALNYSAEADTKEDVDLRSIELARFQEVERALDVQGRLERQLGAEGWASGSAAFALKVSGLIDADVLIRASNLLHRVRAACNTDVEREVLYPGCPCDADGLILAPSSLDLAALDGDLNKVRRMEGSVPETQLRHDDLEKLGLLWDRLNSLAERAKHNGVRLIIDAEETYLQPALDGYVRLLSMKYNRPVSHGDSDGDSSKALTENRGGPLIFGTYQCYLTRQPKFLAASLKHANDNGYALGLKVVRGGYIVKEKQHWTSSGKVGDGPIWPDKVQTDACYNQSIKTSLGTLRRQLDHHEQEVPLSVIFGTHNSDSLSEVFRVLVMEGMASVVKHGKLRLRNDVQGRLGIAQLYGMRDDLSDKIHNTFEESRSPVSLIFIAYGRLRETLPFLGRRAIENKSLMSGAGGAAAERRRVGAELRRRMMSILI